MRGLPSQYNGSKGIVNDKFVINFELSTRLSNGNEQIIETIQ